MQPEAAKPRTSRRSVDANTTFVLPREHGAPLVVDASPVPPTSDQHASSTRPASDWAVPATLNSIVSPERRKELLHDYRTYYERKQQSLQATLLLSELVLSHCQLAKATPLSITTLASVQAEQRDAEAVQRRRVVVQRARQRRKARIQQRQVVRLACVAVAAAVTALQLMAPRPLPLCRALQQRQAAAATRIQAQARGMIVRRSLPSRGTGASQRRDEMGRLLQSTAAETIQAWYRAYRVRVIMAPILESRRRIRDALAARRARRVAAAGVSATVQPDAVWQCRRCWASNKHGERNCRGCGATQLRADGPAPRSPPSVAMSPVSSDVQHTTSVDGRLTSFTYTSDRSPVRVSPSKASLPADPRTRNGGGAAMASPARGSDDAMSARSSPGRRKQLPPIHPSSFHSLPVRALTTPLGGGDTVSPLPSDAGTASLRGESVLGSGTVQEGWQSDRSLASRASRRWTPEDAKWAPPALTGLHDITNTAPPRLGHLGA